MTSQRQLIFFVYAMAWQVLIFDWRFDSGGVSFRVADLSRSVISILTLLPLDRQKVFLDMNNMKMIIYLNLNLIKHYSQWCQMSI